MLKGKTHKEKTVMNKEVQNGRMPKRQFFPKLKKLS